MHKLLYTLLLSLALGLTASALPATPRNDKAKTGVKKTHKKPSKRNGKVHKMDGSQPRLLAYGTYSYIFSDAKGAYRSVMSLEGDSVSWYVDTTQLAPIDTVYENDSTPVLVDFQSQAPGYIGDNYLLADRHPITPQGIYSFINERLMPSMLNLNEDSLAIDEEDSTVIFPHTGLSDVHRMLPALYGTIEINFTTEKSQSLLKIYLQYVGHQIRIYRNVTNDRFDELSKVEPEDVSFKVVSHPRGEYVKTRPLDLEAFFNTPSSMGGVFQYIGIDNGLPFWSTDDSTDNPNDLYN